MDQSDVIAIKNIANGLRRGLLNNQDAIAKIDEILVRNQCISNYPKSTNPCWPPGRGGREMLRDQASTGFIPSMRGSGRHGCNPATTFMGNSSGRFGQMNQNNYSQRVSNANALRQTRLTQQGYYNPCSNPCNAGQMRRGNYNAPSIIQAVPRRMLPPHLQAQQNMIPYRNQYGYAQVPIPQNYSNNC